MIQKYDKISVLWIEDLPDIGLQSEGLGEFGEFFKVIGNANTDAVRTIEEYDNLLVRHSKVLKENNSSIISPFPVEIVSADYDLSKFKTGNNIVGDKNRKFGSNFEDLRSSSKSRANHDKSSHVSEEVQLQSPNYDDYDGCIINTMYLSEFFTHPCGSVVTTYQEPSSRHRCAKKLEKHLERCYQIDLAFSGKRTWESILSAGVDALRKRICKLYDSGDIVLSPSDLMAMAEDAGHDVLTMTSSYGLRRLPVQGLFIDIPQDKRNSAIQEWVEGLLKTKITRQQYERASELATMIWSKYNDDNLVSEQEQLSCLHISYQGDCQNQTDYLLLKNHFKLIQTKRGKKGTLECTADYCYDIRRGSYDKKERQWAVLFLVRMLLKRIMLFMDRTKRTTITQDGITQEQFIKNASFEKEDIYLLLFPVPTSPFPLPWHVGNITKDHGWYKWIENNLDFTVEDLTKGIGLKIGERQLLQGIVMDEDCEFSEDPLKRLDRWSKWGPAKQFLFGPETSRWGDNDE